MMVYIFALIASPLCLYIAGRSEKRVAIIMRAAALAIPCILAGARADSVGTDTALYGGPGFISAAGSSWLEYYSAFAGWHPIGYCIFTWLVAQIFNSRFVFLASIQFIALVPLYMAIRKCSKECDWLGMLVYLLVLFPITLNAMKQSISFGVGALAVVEAWNMKKKRFVFLVAIAVMFHPTAVALLAVYPVAWFFHGVKNSSNGAQQKTLALCVFSSLAAFVLIVGVTAGLIPLAAKMRESFSYAATHMGEGQINESSIILLVISTLVFLSDLKAYSMRKKSGGKLNNALEGVWERGYLFCIFAIGCLAAQLDIIALSLSRFSYYGLAIAPVWVSCFARDGECVEAGEANGGGVDRLSRLPLRLGKKRILSLFMLMLMAYSLFVYVFRGSAGVYPYVFY